MSKETLAEDEVLRKEFAQFATEHGFDLAELSEAELEGVSGGVETYASGVDMSPKISERVLLGPDTPPPSNEPVTIPSSKEDGTGSDGEGES